MGKNKKERRDSEAVEEGDKESHWEEMVSRVGPIANPLASRKLAKKLYKCVKKAQKVKSIRKGVRDVQKYIRKGETGLVIMAGNTSPIDVICHLPAVCEEKDIPYCYTPSREELGQACGSQQHTCVVLIKSHEDFADLYKECQEAVSGLPQPIS